MTEKPAYPRTPDGRYFVAKARLWRCTDPALPEEARKTAVRDLMSARRDVAAARRADDAEALRHARAGVDAAKRRLGERGPVWWQDGAPELTRRAPWTTPYAGWWADLAPAEREAGGGQP